MACTICLEENENLIEIDSDEGHLLNVVPILIKYFSFCLEIKPYNGFVCRQCWSKVEIFNEFYEHIKELHDCLKESKEIIVTEITKNLKEETNLSPLRIDNNLLDENDDAQSKVNDNGAESDDSWAWNMDPLDEFDVKNKTPDTITNINNKITFEIQDVPPIKSIGKKPIAHKRASAAVKSSKQKAKRKKDNNKETNVVVPLSKRIKRQFNEDIYRSADDELLRCNQCDFTCFRNNILYRHLKKVHEKLRFSCSADGCVESFATQKEFDAHTIEYHTRVECSLCHKSVRTVYLTQHMSLNHDQKKHVVCDQCGKVSSNSVKHRKHLVAQHEKQEKLQCDICKTWLANKTSLRIHMSVQHIQKPEKCPVCEKILPNKKSLVKHKAIHNPASKSVKCTLCDKRFRDNYNLKQHFSVHTKTECFCDFCDKSYRTEATVRKHIRKEHPDKIGVRSNQ